MSGLDSATYAKREAAPTVWVIDSAEPTRSSTRSSSAPAHDTVAPTSSMSIAVR